MSATRDETQADVTDIVIRRFESRDSISDLTALVRRAYQQLADRGLRYTATWQDDKVTADRIKGRECFVAELEARIVGTISLSLPGKHHQGTPWYRNSFVAVFGQFGVEPALQRRGIGRRLLDTVERRAVELGATEIALDTAESAKELIDMYARRGYRFIEHAQWGSTNYRSVIMSRSLPAERSFARPR